MAQEVYGFVSPKCLAITATSLMSILPSATPNMGDVTQVVEVQISPCPPRILPIISVESQILQIMKVLSRFSPQTISSEMIKKGNYQWWIRMDKKYMCSLLLVAVFFGSLALAFKIYRVEAQLQTVYIRANGDVEPSWALIQRSGNVYTFTGDLMVDGDATGIIIERDNMTLDGAGYRLSRSPHVAHAYGINLTGRSNVTIQNIEVTTFWDGIVLWNSHNNTIQGNNVTANSGFGIALWNFSDYNTISGNNVAANSADGIGLDLSSYNSIHNNTVTGHYQDGIVLDAYSDHNQIMRNKVVNNGFGIELYDSANNTMSQNNITENANHGVMLYYSSRNNVSKNVATDNDLEGILLSFSHFNLVEGNHLANNEDGLTVGWGSHNNTIYTNTIISNEFGIQVIDASNNTFCHNDLVNNTNQVASSNSINKWDCGYPSGGNIWSDYEERYPNATEIDDSGIWDTPYVIDENNRDNYPIIPEFPSAAIFPLFMIATLLTTMFYRRKRLLKTK